MKPKEVKGVLDIPGMNNMINTAKIIFVVSVAFLGFSCGISHIGTKERASYFSSQEQELEYYYAFTEATKQAMFNNYKDAINLYHKCLKYNPQSGATYFQLSNIYMRLGEIILAKEYAQNAIRRDDSNIWYYLHLASLYQMQRNIDSTIVVYEKIVDLDKSRIEYLFNLALLYNEAKYYEKALKTIKRVEGIAGVNERIIYLKHDLYSKLGRKKEAVRELKEGIDYFPENINIYGLLAEYYSEIGEFENADNIYRQILEKDSSNSKVILSYADYLIGMNHKDRAFKYYMYAIESEDIKVEDKLMIVVTLMNNDKIFNNYKEDLDELINSLTEHYPENMEIRSIRIDFNIKAGNYVDAREDLRYIISKEQGSLNAWRQLIYIDNYLQNLDSVLHYAGKASIIFSEEAVFYIMRGLAWLQKGENKKAIDILLEGERYADRNEEKVQIYGYLGELFRNLGKHQMSDSYFEKALQIDGNNILIRNNYSYYLALRDTALRKAEKLSRYTIEQEPLNATYLDTYAWILFKMGKYKSALKFIEKAVKNDSDNNTEILNHYGDILFVLNRYEKAVAIWQSIVKLNSDSSDVEEKIIQAKRLLNGSR